MSETVTMNNGHEIDWGSKEWLERYKSVVDASTQTLGHCESQHNIIHEEVNTELEY